MKNVGLLSSTKYNFYQKRNIYKPLELRKNKSNKNLTPGSFPKISNLYSISPPMPKNQFVKTQRNFCFRKVSPRKSYENKKVMEMTKFEFKQFLEQYANSTKRTIRKLEDPNTYHLKQSNIPELRPQSKESFYFNSNKTLNETKTVIKLKINHNNKLIKISQPDANANVPRAQSSSAFAKQANIISNLETIQTVENTTEDNINSNKLSKYVLGKVIGKGAYATVKHCYNKENKKNYAIKIYSNILMSKKNYVYKEIQVLKELNHKNLIQLFDYFEEQKSLYLIMEEAKGISLLSFLKSVPNHRVDELRAKRIFNQIISALAYIHKNNICHRDIKLDNIIIDDCLNIKLIDFGFGIHFKSLDTKLKLFCGTPNYMPPEIIKKVEYYGPAADMWSAGIVLFHLLCGTFPFRGSNEKELFTKICNGTFQVPNNVSVSAHNLIQKLLTVNPQKRITAEGALKHEWIVNVMNVFSYNLKKK